MSQRDRPLCAAIVTIAWLGWTLCAAPARACDLIVADMLRAARPAASDQFGAAVAFEGDVLLIGARNDDDAAPDAGAVHVLRFGGGVWAHEQVLLASDAQATDLFGSAVALHGDLAVIGAPGDDDAAGAAGSAYVFRYADGTWTEIDKLLPSVAGAGDSFGSVVAVHGTRVVVGSPNHDIPGSNAGAVDLFQCPGDRCIFEQRLQAEDIEAADNFGTAIAAGDNTLLIGAYLEDSACPEDDSCNSGAVYVFENDGDMWAEVDKLVPADSALFDHFGCFISLAGDGALIGAYHNDDDGTSSGSAYIYAYEGNWTEQAKLTASDAAPLDRFGWCGALSSEYAVIGAPGNNTPDGDDAGAAYVFREAGGVWVQTARLLGPSGSAFHELGDVLAVSGNTIVAGVIRDNVAGSSAGAAWLYPLTPDRDGDGVPDACDTCESLSECADLDGNNISDDVCSWHVCGPPCQALPRVFADLGGPNGDCVPDGAADGNDRFHALNCFANLDTTGVPGSSYPCEASPPQAFNADAGGSFGSCFADGVCDGSDAFHALNAFAGTNTCSCPSGQPAPTAP